MTARRTGYDAEWLGDALQDKGLKLCISSRKSRNEPAKYGKRRNRWRDRIEIRF